MKTVIYWKGTGYYGSKQVGSGKDVTVEYHECGASGDKGLSAPDFYQSAHGIAAGIVPPANPQDIEIINMKRPS